MYFIIILISSIQSNTYFDKFKLFLINFSKVQFTNLMTKPVNDQTRSTQLQSNTDSLHQIFIVLIDLLTPNTWQRNINYHKRKKINCVIYLHRYLNGTLKVIQITFKCVCRSFKCNKHPSK